MRGPTTLIARVVVAVPVVIALATPAQAKPRDSGRWFEKRVDPVVKVLQRMFAFKSGDGLSDPRP